MQRDAIERLDLASMLLEPELLDSVQPDVHLVSTLVSLNRVMPEIDASGPPGMVVGLVVAEIERRIANQTRAAVTGALNRANRTRRPRLPDMDWNATIRRNLDHYLPEQRTVVPERLIGYGRSSNAVSRDVIVAMDQSGSMAESLVYAAVFGATLASIRSVQDVADRLRLRGRRPDRAAGRPGGGAVRLPARRRHRHQPGHRLLPGPDQPARPRPILVLISDLFEGGIPAEMLRRIAELRRDGVTVISLLALSDSGAPAYDHEHAAALAALGVPAFACTPDRFPELLEVALGRRRYRAVGVEVLQWPMRP